MEMLRNRYQNGNILFLILLAVVLFAALAMAITQSLRGGNQEGMSKEAADAAASDIMSYFTQIDTAVQRMMLVGGIPLEQIDFYDTTNKAQTGGNDHYNNTACASATCEVFNPAGGGVSARKFEKYGDQSQNTGDPGRRVPGHHAMQVINVQHLGTPLNEVAIRIDFIKAEVCRSINRAAGMPECGTIPGHLGSGGWTPFSGDATAIAGYLAASNPYNFSGPAQNKTTFCQMSCNAGGYGSLYHVIIER